MERCCNYRNYAAEGKQIENAQAQNRPHFRGIDQRGLNDLPRIHPDGRPDDEQGNPIDNDFPAQFSYHIPGDIKEESQNLLRTKDCH